jgi:DNA replication protein DnaC
MSADASTLLLEHHLKVLKLPTFVRDYKSVAAVCAQEGCDYPTFLLRLAERELIDRERRAAERRIRDARFPVIKTIDTFDYRAQPSINQALVRELIQSGEYMSKGRTCCWSVIPAPAKPIWRLRSVLRRVPKAKR